MTSLCIEIVASYHLFTRLPAVFKITEHLCLKQALDMLKIGKSPELREKIGVFDQINRDISDLTHITYLLLIMKGDLHEKYALNIYGYLIVIYDFFYLFIIL